LFDICKNALAYYIASVVAVNSKIVVLYVVGKAAVIGLAPGSDQLINTLTVKQRMVPMTADTAPRTRSTIPRIMLVFVIL
jgi:hypothetical protein